jgi:hypothetical protein
MQEHMDVTMREIAAGDGAWDREMARSRSATRQYAEAQGAKL